MRIIPYSSLVGSLMYAQVCTCPDIAFVVGMLGDSCPIGVLADSCPAGAPWMRE